MPWRSTSSMSSMSTPANRLVRERWQSYVNFRHIRRMQMPIKVSYMTIVLLLVIPVHFLSPDFSSFLYYIYLHYLAHDPLKQAVLSRTRVSLGPKKRQRRKLLSAEAKATMERQNLFLFESMTKLMHRKPRTFTASPRYIHYAPGPRDRWRQQERIRRQNNVLGSRILRMASTIDSFGQRRQTFPIKLGMKKLRIYRAVPRQFAHVPPRVDSGLQSKTYPPALPLPASPPLHPDPNHWAQPKEANPTQRLPYPLDSSLDDHEHRVTHGYGLNASKVYGFEVRDSEEQTTSNVTGGQAPSIACPIVSTLRGTSALLHANERTRTLTSFTGLSLKHAERVRRSGALLATTLSSATRRSKNGDCSDPRSNNKGLSSKAIPSPTFIANADVSPYFSQFKEAKGNQDVEKSQPDHTINQTANRFPTAPSTSTAALAGKVNAKKGMITPSPTFLSDLSPYSPIPRKRCKPPPSSRMRTPANLDELSTTATTASRAPATATPPISTTKSDVPIDDPLKVVYGSNTTSIASEKHLDALHRSRSAARQSSRPILGYIASRRSVSSFLTGHAPIPAPSGSTDTKTLKHQSPRSSSASRSDFIPESMDQVGPPNTTRLHSLFRDVGDAERRTRQEIRATQVAQAQAGIVWVPPPRPPPLRPIGTTRDWHPTHPNTDKLASHSEPQSSIPASRPPHGWRGRLPYYHQRSELKYAHSALAKGLDYYVSTGHGASVNESKETVDHIHPSSKQSKRLFRRINTVTKGHMSQLPTLGTTMSASHPPPSSTGLLAPAAFNLFQSTVPSSTFLPTDPALKGRAMSSSTRKDGYPQPQTVRPPSRSAIRPPAPYPPRAPASTNSIDVSHLKYGTSPRRFIQVRPSPRPPMQGIVSDWPAKRSSTEPNDSQASVQSQTQFVPYSPSDVGEHLSLEIPDAFKFQSSMPRLVYINPDGSIRDIPSMVGVYLPPSLYADDDIFAGDHSSSFHDSPMLDMGSVVHEEVDSEVDDHGHYHSKYRTAEFTSQGGNNKPHLIHAPSRTVP